MMKKIFVYTVIFLVSLLIADSIGRLLWGKNEYKNDQLSEMIAEDDHDQLSEQDTEKEVIRTKMYVTYPRIVAAEGVKDIKALSCSFLLDLGGGQGLVPACAVYFNNKDKRAIFLTEKDLLITEEKDIPEWADIMTFAVIIKVIDDEIMLRKEMQKLIDKEKEKDPAPNSKKNKDINLRNRREITI